MRRVTLCAASACGLIGIAGCSGLRSVEGGTGGARFGAVTGSGASVRQSAATMRDTRLDWWRDARFGMFIHWGLYSIPAGEWPGKGTGHAEWIRYTAQIPVGEYEKLRERFNPVKFDADEWVAAAKGAGMKYVCITTKHHDGFCLFDTKQAGGAEWSVMNTPFKRDIMKEIAEACRKQDVVPCWYHSIMDWHHPDYLPRRPWEEKDRPAAGADFERFNAYLKNQVTELLTNYGPIGVMWFDGQWEGTWTHERGVELYNLCRSLQPDVIVNNRVDKGGGQFQMTRTEGGEGGVKYVGDFGTPEQEIPPTGYPGVDWETCMTMNRHWGYNAVDRQFKSTEDLLHKLADIASKGGNFLLNVGPTAEGEIPKESLQRLAEIGEWMAVNGEAIHGTQAGPFEKTPAFGRCTMRPINPGIAAGKGGNPSAATRLYLHVFGWPTDGRLVVPGLFNEPRGAYLLADKTRELTVTRGGPELDSLIIELPLRAPDAHNSVVVLDIEGRPDVARSPVIAAEAETGSDVFVENLRFTISSPAEGVELHYTTDGTTPTAASADFHKTVSAVIGMRRDQDGPASDALQVSQTTTVSARAYRNGRAASPIVRRTFTKVEPLPPVATEAKTAGVGYQYFEGDWDRVPNFTSLKPVATGVAQAFDRRPLPAGRTDRFGFRYHGYITAPANGVYTFWTASDDGSNLYIDGQKVVDNDGLHSLDEKSGSIALGAGFHAIKVDFFEKGGGHELDVWWSRPGRGREPLRASTLRTE